MIPVPEKVREELAAAYGVDGRALIHFGGGGEESDGTVYAIPTGGGKHLLKVLTIPAEGQRAGLLCLEERLKFVRYLGENGARIVFPELSPGGNLYERFEYEDHIWIGYLMEKARGLTMREKYWNLDFFTNWGQTVGLCHRLAKGYPTWKGFTDPETGDVLLTWRREWQGFYDWCQDEDVKAKWAEIGEELEGLPVERDSFGFIHNDPHMWNLLVDKEEITLLDFDVANHHWFMTDISIACQSILIFHTGGMNGPVHGRENLMDFLGAFMAGYGKENDLSPDWLNRLDLFIAYRRILLFIVMNEWIKSQPKLHDRWKKMILSPSEVAGEWA